MFCTRHDHKGLPLADACVVSDSTLKLSMPRNSQNALVVLLNAFLQLGQMRASSFDLEFFSSLNLTFTSVFSEYL